MSRRARSYWPHSAVRGGNFEKDTPPEPSLFPLLLQPPPMPFKNLDWPWPKGLEEIRPGVGMR